MRQRVLVAARFMGSEQPEPLARFLGEEVALDDIRLVPAHLQAGGRK